MTHFKGKVAVVSGAGSGMGRSLAKLLAEAGCDLALSDIQQAGLAETLAQIAALDSGINVSQHIVDVAELAQVEAFAEAVLAEHGKVNLVFNNAGVALSAEVADASYEDMHWLMNINFWGVVHGSKAFLSALIASDDGHIVNISSVFGLMAVPTQSAYNASKFAVRGFSEAMRIELAGGPVKVSTVFPAGVQTGIVDSARVPNVDAEQQEQNLERVEKFFATTADDAARQILRGVSRNQPRILVAKGARRIDWLTRLAPTRVSQFLHKRYREQGTVL